MKCTSKELLTRFPISGLLSLEAPRKQYCFSIPSMCRSLTLKQDETSSILKRMNKQGKRDDKFAHGTLEHARMGTKVAEILKGKLSLGARILQVGGVTKVFRKMFSVGEGEKLLKTSQCYLSTSAGPIAGLLFISTDRIAFCSDRAIKLSSTDGTYARLHYKVMIPLMKIKEVNQSVNVKNPSEKYIQVVTVDDFDFWFMGFFNYRKALNYLHQARLLLKCQ